MRKIIVGYVSVISLLFPTFSESLQINQGIHSYNLIDFDAKNISNAIQDKFGATISQLISSITGDLPQGIAEPLSKLLKNIYEGFACKTPSLNENFSLSGSFSLPESITIKLPCKTVSISLPEDIKEQINNAANPAIGKGVSNEIANCIRNPDGCTRNDIKRLVKSQNPINTALLEGISNNIADKPSVQVENEMKNEITLMSTSDVEYFQKEPTKTTVNLSSQNSRFGKMNEAGTTFGEIPLPSAENFGNKDPLLKGIYNFVGQKQIARREYIAALQKILQKERIRLAQMASMVKGICNSEWNIPVIGPQYSGGVLSELPKNSSPVEVKFSKSPSPPSKPEGEKIFQSKGGFVEYAIVGLQKSVNPNEITRCCCDCGCVWAAKNKLSSQISSAETHIMKRITEAERLLATVISREAYATRQQINNDIKAQTELLKKIECLKANLEYQRNYLLTLQIETNIAILRVLYSHLDKEEVEKYEQIKKSIYIQSAK